MKTTVKLEMIVIIQGNIKVLRIAYAIQDIVYLKKFLQVFMIDLTIDYHFMLKELAEELKKDNLLDQEKTLKNT